MEANAPKRISNPSSSASDDCIKVALRVRPLVRSEVERGCRSIVAKTRDTAQVVVNNKDQFTFNFAFSPDETQEMIYVNAIKPLVLKLIKGYNVTILAYGQTGSGKTHTMGTCFDGNQSSEEMGLIPRAIDEIFKSAENQSNTHLFEISCSFIELYQEVLYDLLSPNNREQSVVDIREDQTKSIFIANLTEKIVSNSGEAFDCLIKGSSGRAVGATAMNATSSRSHAIFTVTVRMTCIADPDNATNSKFHLVDLAGSERSNKTKATGQRFKEGVKINQGLLALGNVISSLGCGQGGHISYRDSKLTRLLQDSLGGNSVTLMIACVSPADYNMDETLSTLRYADRAKQIKNTAIVNMDPKAAEIKRLKAENHDLMMKLMEYQSSGVSLSQVANLKKDSKRRQSIVPTDELHQLRTELNATTQENLQLHQKLQKAVLDLSSMSVKYYAAEMSNEQLLTTMKQLTTTVNSLNAEIDPTDCPAEFVIQAQSISELKKLIGQATDAAQANHLELSYSPRQDRTFCISEESDDHTSQCDVDFQSRQMNFQEALNEIQEQIRLKTEVSDRVAKNCLQFTQFDETLQEKLVDYESKIKAMELELIEVKQSAEEPKKSKAISAKIAEERRKKVLQLEAEIKAMQKKSHHQEMMLKQQEQYKKQTATVQAELVLMKKRKVELIKQMKQTNDTYRKEKAEANKKVMKAEEESRKLKTKLTKEKLEEHRKNTVLKRKMDEFVAVNKRLKDSLDKHRSAQLQRQKTVNLSRVGNQTASALSTNWIENEIEIIYTLVDAKQSLMQMLDDRGQLSKQLMALKKQRHLTEEDKATIAQLHEDIAMRNAQIEEIQDKIKSTDLDDQVNKAAEGLNSMPEARSAVKQLFNTLVDLRILFDDASHVKQDKTDEVQSLKEQLRLATEKWDKRAKEMRQEFQQLRLSKNKLESAYEEKVAMLLKELNSSVNGVQSDAQRINEEMLDEMQAKLNAANARMKELMSTTGRRAATKRGYSDYVYTSGSEDDVEIDSDHNRDPDWEQTPREPRKPLVRGRSTTNSTITATDADGSVRALEDSNGSITTRRHGCSCKQDCGTKHCRCLKTGLRCGKDCRCPATCKNVEANNEDEKNNDFDPNQTKVLTTRNLSADRLITPEADKENSAVFSITPKKHSTDMDATTTPYPYKNKKMQPLLD